MQTAVVKAAPVIAIAFCLGHATAIFGFSHELKVLKEQLEILKKDVKILKDWVNYVNNRALYHQNFFVGYFGGEEITEEEKKEEEKSPEPDCEN